MRLLETENFGFGWPDKKNDQTEPITTLDFSQINSWGARKISFAERLQLIQSMLCGIQVE